MSGTFDQSSRKVEEREVGGLVVDFLPAVVKKFRAEALFIPGSGLTSKNGIPVLEGFSQAGFHSMSVNLKGRRGELPPAEYTRRGIADLNADMRDLRDALLLRGLPYHEHILVGHSSGGRIAMEQAKEHTPAALILLCPSRPKGFTLQQPQEGELERLKTSIAEGKVITRGRADLLRWFGGRIPEDFDENFESKYKPMLGFESNQVRLETYTDPADIQRKDIVCPTLVVGGTFDNPEKKRELAEFLGADYMQMDSSHMLMLEKEWPKFEMQIMTWLAGKISATSA